MREKIRTDQPMMTADQAREEVRSPLGFLVRHHVDRGTPRMRAYERVATQIGRTPAWVQRVLGRRDDATVGLHDALNIRAAYDRLCSRIASAADAVEAENSNLRGELDAALSRDWPVAPGAPGAPVAQAPVSRRPGRAAAPALAAADARPRPEVAADLTDLPLWRAVGDERP